MNVGVIFGGSPMEFDIATKTAEYVASELKKINHNVHCIDLADFIKKPVAMDVAYLIMYGCPGEDGTIQGYLELLNIPYNGSGVLASSLCKDKSKFKHVIQNLKKPTSSFISFGYDQYRQNKKSYHEKIRQSLHFPVIFKPALQGGSSLGITKVNEDDFLLIDQAINHVYHYDRKVIVENYFAGSDYVIGAICDTHEIQLLPMMKGDKSSNFKQRYLNNGKMFTVADDVPTGLVDRMKRDVKIVLSELDISGVCYVDLRINSKKDQYSMIEIGTTYGMLSNSVVPIAAEVMGLSFGQLLTKDIQIALKRHDLKKEKYGLFKKS